VGPRYRAAGSLKSLKMVHLEGVLGDDFVGLVLAFSDTHEPEHPRRRGTAPCASRGREGHRRRAPGRRDRFALNRGSGWGWWVAGGMSGQFVGRVRPSQQPTTPTKARRSRSTHRQDRSHVGRGTKRRGGAAVRSWPAGGERTATAGEWRRRGVGWPPCPAVAAARARRTLMHLAQPTGLARVPSHQSLSFALRNQAALQIRAGGARWPSNYGRRRRPFALVSCRFGVEIGARSVTWSHHEPAMPSVYLGEPPEAPLGRVRHPVRIRFGPGTLRPNQI